MQDHQVFRFISRKFTNGVLLSCPRCHRKNVGRNMESICEKVRSMLHRPRGAPLDCSVAEYGQLALWTGMVGEAPGHAQCQLRGLGMARHSNEGSRQRVRRCGRYTECPHGPRRLARGSRLSGITDAQTGGRGRGGAGRFVIVASAESGIRFRQAFSCLVEMLVRKKSID